MHPTDPGQGEFARLLAEIQQRTGLTDQRIAEAAGVNRSQVWRWIHSGSAPGYEPVRRLAAHLIAAYPDLADQATALLPAAGYESPPATPGPDSAPPPAIPDSGAPEPAESDLNARVLRVVTAEVRRQIEADEARAEAVIRAQVKAEIAAHPPGTPAAQIFTDPFEVKIWGVTGSTPELRVDAITRLRIGSRKEQTGLETRN